MAGLQLNAILGILLILLQSTVLASRNSDNGHWVDIWGTMPQLVEYYNLPPAPYNGSGVVFENATLRQTVFITQDASTIRLRISNAFGGSDLPITAVTLALPANGTAGISAIKPSSLRNVTFSGHTNFTVPNGALVVSDPLEFPVKAQSIATISIYLQNGQTTNYVTGHPGSRVTSFYTPGNAVAAADLTNPAVYHEEHWFFIDALEGWLPQHAGALIIIGDSITDGRGSTTNANNRWPDQLLARMQSHNTTLSTSSIRSIAVINEAAGGNRILYDGLGPNALGRLDRDALSQPGLRYVMIYEGVNDLGTAATDAAAQESMGTRIIAAYDQMITRLHARGIAVFGCTITPFCGPGQPYSDANREAQRQRVNGWIRSSGRFDAVADFDVVARDPANGTQLNPNYNSGDYLHMNPDGYKALAEAVDLGLFEKYKDGVSVMT